MRKVHSRLGRFKGEVVIDSQGINDDTRCRWWQSGENPFRRAERNYALTIVKPKRKKRGK